VFPQLKARRAGVPAEGATPAQPAPATRFGGPARAVRPLGFAAVAVAAAVTVAGCKPGSFTGASGSQFGSTSSSSSLTAQALQLAAQQTQQISSLNAGLQIQATGALNASMAGHLNEVLSPTPMMSVTGNAGSLGHVRIILDNGTAYLRSPFVTRAYGRPWIMGSYAGLSSSSGLNLGSLLGLLQASNPMTQTQLLGYGTNLRMMGHSWWDGSRMTEYGGHYMLSSVLRQLGSSPDMRTMVASWMTSGIQMTRFRVWMDHAHLVRKLVLIEVAGNTTVTITLLVHSFNQPMQISTPPSTVVIVLPGTTPSTPTSTPAVTPAATPAMTPAVRPTMTPAPTPMASVPVTSTPTPGVTATPTAATPASMPSHW
jgi:hypothetical protein